MIDPDSVLIATERPAVREWIFRHWPELANAHITTRPRDHEIEGRHVIGKVALRQAALARSWSVIDFQTSPRGELKSADEMDDHGAYLVTYTVVESERPLLEER